MVQSWADDWEWNQMWRLLKPDEAIPAKDTTGKKDTTKTDTTKKDSIPHAVPYLGNFANVYESSVHYVDNHLFVELGSAFKDGADVRILDLQGREVLRSRARHSSMMDVRNLAPGIYHVVVRDGVHTDMMRFKK